MKPIKEVKDMLIEEQRDLMAKKVLGFEGRTFTALSASGVIWIDSDNNEAIIIKNSETIDIIQLR